MTTHTENLLIRMARAVDAYNTATDYMQAADEAVDTPGNAAKVCWDASSALRSIGDALTTLADSMSFAARRYEKAERDEKATGVEFRAGGDAA